MIRSALVVLFSIVVVPSAARAGERPVTALLWLGGASGIEVSSQVDAALASSTRVAPIADADVKRLLVEGGPATRVRERVQAGRERFAALRDLPDADAMLAEAEEIALAGMDVSAACAQLVEIARLRLRFAELTKDEARASHATWLLAACLPAPTGEDAAAIAKHAQPPAKAAAPLRIESDPPGADVYIDLRPVGKTPLDLAGPRRAGALLDVERAGLRKVHRALDDKGGTLAVSLARDDGLTLLVDRLREGPEAKEADCVDLARRVGASQLLVMRAGRAGMLDARLLDVARASWVKAPVEIKWTTPPGTLDAPSLLAYAEPPPAKPADSTTVKLYDSKPGTQQPAAAAGGATPDKKEPVPAYKRWYTWVIGGLLIGGVAAYVIADHVGDDQVTVHVSR